MQSLLFSTEMVKALMADRKTETRRMRGLDEINENPDRWKVCGHSREMDVPRPAIKYNNRVWWMLSEKDRPYHPEAERIVLPCPFQIGPCWVRETFYKSCAPDGKGTAYYFKVSAGGRIQDIPDWSWKPSIHMPFIAARNFIHIDEVRLERIHDITEEGAISEGVMWNPFDDREEISDRIYYNYTNKSFIHLFAKPSFESLITSINGPECWERNMWTWVIKFHRISKPNQ